MASLTSLEYVCPYETGETIFGRAATAEELIARVRTFSWELSFFVLARLAAAVANTPEGSQSERIRRMTIDPLTELTGQPGNEPLLERGRRSVRERRARMVLAHEEAILFLQHLVLLEGGIGSDAPSDAEVSLWLAAANDHLAKWQVEDTAGLTDQQRLAAEMVRISRFNNSPDLLRTVVRTVSIFGDRPPTTALADPAAWQQLQDAAFGKSFLDYFETGPGLLSVMLPLWGAEGHPLSDPVLHMPTWLAESQLDHDAVVESLRWMIGTRDTIVNEIKKRLRPDGLPHSPTALLHTPLVQVAPTKFIVASPWSVVNQLRTGIWARYLQAAKDRDSKKGPDLWNSAFGYMVEHWCGRVASEAGAVKTCSAKIMIPTYSGAADEVEDVVLLEGEDAILFSVKSRLVEAKVSREAFSPATTLAWYEKFFFEKKNQTHRGGCLRLLDARMTALRAGAFERYGVARDLRVYPVIVTYDSLGESHLLYRWLEEQCTQRALLQQGNIGPLTLARVEDFEQLMARASQGRSLIGLLRNRERGDQHRRLDQLIVEVDPPDGPGRLPFFEPAYREIVEGLKVRLGGG